MQIQQNKQWHVAARYFLVRQHFRQVDLEDYFGWLQLGIQGRPVSEQVSKLEKEMEFTVEKDIEHTKTKYAKFFTEPAK